MSLTFFFSDIEDSTGLLTRLGPGYPHVLEVARELQRKKLSLAIASACIGGGQGIAMLIENPAVS